MSGEHGEHVLGINGAYHESAACVVRDGIVVAAAEEERFTRRKHAKDASVGNGGELPVHAIRWCLDAAGISGDDVVAVGYSIDPHRRLENARFDDVVVDGDWGSERGEQRFHDGLLTVPSQLAGMGVAGSFTWFAHHRCHAASAFHASPFDAAAILTVDGIGEVSSTALGVGDGSDMRLLEEITYPSSLGFVWEKVSQLLGFGEHDAAKVMGLAAYGDASRHRKLLDDIVVIDDGGFTVDGSVFRFRSGDLAPLEEAMGVTRRAPGDPLTADACDVAAALQSLTNDVVLHLVRRLHALTGEDALCMAGGVALNCVANTFAFEHGPFRSLYVPAATHDAGTAIGAAHLAWSDVLGRPRPRGVPATPYTGPSYDAVAVERAVAAAGLVAERVDRIEEKVAALLASGAVVGWFQGAMEVGPRALGNRSLLADPRDASARDVLNRRVKHREPFRPFAPSVLAEEAASWFDIAKPTPAAELMLMAYAARPRTIERAPAIVHVDGTSRVQLVRREVNPRFHALIAAFGRLTGVPMVLNTSFNDDEPIVCAPEDAIHTFLSTEIDHLAIGDLLVARP